MEGRARTRIVEVDLSTRVPSFPGLYGAMVLDIPKGKVLTPTLITSEDNFLKKCTLDGKISTSDSTNLFEATMFLKKSNKLWVVRPDMESLYGGAYVSQSIPVSTLNVSFNTSLNAVLLRATTETDATNAKVVYDILTTGDIIHFQSSNGSLPTPLSSDTAYYIIKKDATKYSMQLALSYDDAIKGNYILFESEASGSIKLVLPNSKANGEQEFGVVNPDNYDMTTSDGRTGNWESVFHVDMDGDYITVDKVFYNTVETGDELTLVGSQEDLPLVDSGLELVAGESVFAIKVPMEGEFKTRYTIQIARTNKDALTDEYIGLKTKGTSNFKLQLVNKTNQTEATIEVDTDSILVSNKFFSCLETNDKLQIASFSTAPESSEGALDTSTIFYAIKGTNNDLHLSLEKNGDAIMFSSTGADVNLVNTSKVGITDTLVDLSKDSLSVDEGFYEEVETGFKVQVTSDGTLPSGLVANRDYWVIKTDTAQVIKLATSEDNATLDIPVNITDSGVLDTTSNQEHTIVSYNNETLHGLNRKCLYIYTSTPCEEEIYYKLLHYPYGAEATWTEEDQAIADTVKEPGAFILSLYKKASTDEMELVESYLMSRNQDHIDGYGSNIYCETVATKSSLIRLRDNKGINKDVYPQNQLTYAKLANGVSGKSATVGEAVQALKKLGNKRKYPVTLIMDAGRSIPAYQQAVIDLCESRGATLGIFSTPIELEQSSTYKEDLVEYKRRQLITSTSYGAVYTPHVQIYDSYNDRNIYISPTGHVGAQISETAATSRIWFAPAGNRRGVLNVLGVAREFDTGDMDYLYDNNLNPIEYHETKGIRLWGQKTLLTRPSSLDRVNVRLLLCEIEPVIEEFLDDFIFEFNDETTRYAIETGLTEYLQGIQRDRGIYSFKIQCDSDNNTADIIDANELECWIFIQPTKVSEVQTGRLIITRTGASFTFSL